MSSKYKRKRVYSKAAKGLAQARPPASRKKAFTPGVDRTGGFYGRFSGRDGELKFFDVDFNDAVISNNGTVFPSLNLIPQGITQSTRVGRKCTIKSIYWRYELELPLNDAVATPERGDMCRLIVFLDKQCNGATAVTTDILEGTDWKDFRNLANSQRFTIFLDKTITLNYLGLASDGAGVVTQAPLEYAGTFYKACNIPIEYNATTGVITEIRSNNIGILLISNHAQAGLLSKIRLRFAD